MGHEKFEIVNRRTEKIYGNKWIANKEAKACVVIVHGMSEYSFRYNEFALFLNEHGYDVYALDHIGHGLNCPEEKGLGIWPIDGFDQCVDNVCDEVELLQKEGKEVYVFGHSMGSFITQAFMEKYPGKVKKIILCGSSGPQGLHKMGKMMADMHAFLKNPNKPSKFMTKLAFGSYGKKIPNKKTSNDWLSWNEENVAVYNDDPYCGFVQSRMFFKSFMGGLAKLHKKENLAKIDPSQKVLIIGGEDDPVGNYAKTLYKLNEIYKKHGMDSSLIIYPHMRHEILNEDNKLDVMQDVVNYLDI